MSRYTFHIDGENFPTKAALLDRIRDILKATPNGSRLTQANLRFMTAVLRLHPHATQKIGCGIAGMEARRNPVYTNTRGFWIVRIDGTATDFSFLECVNPSSQRQRFNNACRAAIAPTIMAFKAAALNSPDASQRRCPYTGEGLSFANSHVDHVAPLTFAYLVNGFIRDHHLAIAEVEFNGVAEDGIVQETFADQDLLAQWVAYHNERCVLRAISATANLRLQQKGCFDG